MAEQLQQALDEMVAAVPADVDWGIALSVFILREMEARQPGFRAAVRQRVIDSVGTTTGETEQVTSDLRAGLMDLAQSWVFKD